LPEPRVPDVVERRLSRSPRVWAGAVLVAAGLGLILLGGCFLIGVLELLHYFGTPQGGEYPVRSGEVFFLEVVLYGMAFVCFLAAAVLLLLGLHGLLRIIHERSGES
jgi:hypothetical protein